MQTDIQRTTRARRKTPFSPCRAAHRVIEKSLRPGATVYYAGDAAEFYYEIIEGTIRCCRLTVDGRRQIYRFIGAGEMFGLSGEDVHSHSAEAVTNVTLRCHPLTRLNIAMDADRSIRERVMQSLRDELTAVREHMMMLGRMTAEEKVALFLLTLTEQGGKDFGLVRIPMTRSDIADYLGLTLETVSRKMNAFKQDGVISFSRSTEFRIEDLVALEDLLEAA